MKTIYHRYETGLKNCSSIHLIPTDIYRGELPLYVEVLCKNRNNLMTFLKNKNIQCKLFYPNLNRAAYFDCSSTFVNANKFESQGLTLPCGPDQSIDNIDRVIDAILSYENQSCEYTKQFSVAEA